MPDDFPDDVFLSHSAKDKNAVREPVEPLKADGLREWFDAWETKPGDSIPTKLEEGLERSRVLACPAETPARRRMLCMSADAFGSAWAPL
jgi:TIR domain